MSEEKQKGLTKIISDKFTTYFNAWYAGRKNLAKTKKEQEQYPHPKCSRCFSDLDEGSSVDCFYPYHVEWCVCSGCMTDQERQNRDKWILYKKSQEQKP